MEGWWSGGIHIDVGNTLCGHVGERRSDQMGFKAGNQMEEGGDKSREGLLSGRREGSLTLEACLLSLLI